MKRILVLIALACILGGAASPAEAGVRACTSQLVTAGLCTSASDSLMYFSLPTTDPDGAGARVSVATQVVEGCALYFGYQATIGGTPNPEGKAAFCERSIRSDFLKSLGALYYASLAEAARQSALAATPADPVP